MEEQRNRGTEEVGNRRTEEVGHTALRFAPRKRPYGSSLRSEKWEVGRGRAGVVRCRPGGSMGNRGTGNRRTAEQKNRGTEEQKKWEGGRRSLAGMSGAMPGGSPGDRTNSNHFQNSIFRITSKGL